MKRPRTIHIDRIFDQISGKEFGNLIDSIPLYFRTLLVEGDTSQLESMNPNMALLFETINKMFQIRFGKTIEQILESEG